MNVSYSNAAVASDRIGSTEPIDKAPAQENSSGVSAGSIEPIEMKVTETATERAAAFRLVHQNYLRAGLTPDNAMQMRVMKHHLVDTTDVMIAKQNRDVVYTVTLVRDGLLGMPAESLFTEEIAAMRKEGLHLAEVSCVAGEYGDDNKKQGFEVLVRAIGLTIQVARRRGVDRLILAVHPRHAKVYRRLFGCEIITDVKQYEAVQGNPAVLCTHDFKQLDQRRYPLYDQVYGTHYRPWQLDGVRMSEAEKTYFQQAIGSSADAFLSMSAA
ncbi:N-acyl amino acid synthase FeeM domain-containing protein [Novipirellula artificiosorum]|uniref:N-acyl amino acid synthase FeeM catalytic core domain-containing protein n=1 Tax=Novipirellula artificiosorum TaxID=2528016 RepID=A0A5C6DSN0_9BACT|nr:hypothetical protein [Novipirellula artificiosorum]TWU39738.1 hypothetical protein Poly41_25940 [Novipirellula artificiosorum]